MTLDDLLALLLKARDKVGGRVIMLLYEDGDYLDVAGISFGTDHRGETCTVTICNATVLEAMPK